MRVKVKTVKLNAGRGFEKHIGEVFDAEVCYFDRANDLFWREDELELPVNLRGFSDEELQEIVDRAFEERVVRGSKFQNIKTGNVYTVSDRGFDVAIDKPCVVYKDEVGTVFIRELEEFKEKFLWVER